MIQVSGGCRAYSQAGAEARNAVPLPIGRPSQRDQFDGDTGLGRFQRHWFQFFRKRIGRGGQRISFGFELGLQISQLFLQSSHVVFSLAHIFRFLHGPPGASNRGGRFPDICRTDGFSAEKGAENRRAHGNGRLQLTTP